MPYAQLESARIYYEVAGKGSPVLLLHNYFGTVAAWSAQHAALAERFHVIAADARGHGRSTYAGGRLRLRDAARDTAQLIEHLGLWPVHIVGSSLGALTGLAVARDRPELVRSLTAVGPPHLIEPACWKYMDRVIYQIFPADEARWEADHQQHDTHHVRDVLIPNFLHDRIEQPADQIEAVQRAGAITCPTLIALGDNDPVFPLARALDLCQRIAGAELFVLPRGGHLPHRAKPAIFNQVLLDFLTRHA